MSTHAEATSVRQEIVVAAPVERAFRVFTEQFDRVKPSDHTLLDAELEATVLEPRAGGRIYDRGVDGSECEWATMLAFEPPDRFVFSWNISTSWEQLEPDPARRSEVEVSFAAEGPDRTRVAIEHRHIDRQSDGWEGVRDAVAGENGWSLYLSRFAELI